jgi:hypothetical protein
MAGPGTLYQTGDHASRPANGAGCVLYTCTTHNKVYRDDGSSWTDFIDLATGSGVAAHLADASDAHDASAISFSPTGTIAATDVQAAIAEVASEAGGGASDLVYVHTPADTAINSTSDVTIVSRNVTGVAAGDQLIVEALFTLINDSGAGRVYNISLDFDGAFPAEFITASLTNSATAHFPFHLRGMFDVRATNLTYGLAQMLGPDAGIADDGNKTMNSSALTAKIWGTQTAIDATGTCTVSFLIRSASASATQTMRLLHFTIRKVTPT